MATQAVADSATSHSIGILGSALGLQTGELILTAVSVAVIVLRFVYDTVKFVHYLMERKHYKQIKEHKEKSYGKEES